jgi:addiction module HigA family antidote
MAYAERGQIMEKLDIIYPGEILKLEFMEPLEITGYRLAQELGVGQIAISQIINNKRKITPSMALKLSKFFGNSAEFWINLQNKYDLEVAQEAEQESLRKIKPFKYPVPEIPKGKSTSKKQSRNIS